MKRFLTAFSALAITLSCLSPALGAEKDTGFVDVHPGDWFAPYVEVCVEQGLMKGVGDDRFDPERTLSETECLTLALRLYDMERGGTGALKHAPEELGKMVLTLADGTQITGYQGDDDPFLCWSYNGAYSRQLEPPGETPEEKEAWCKAHEGPATLAAAGQVWQGETHLFIASGHQPLLDFSPSPEDQEAMSQAITQDQLWADLPGPDKWWRDTCYTYLTLENEEAKESFSHLYSLVTTATRESYATALAAAAGELEEINQVPSLPDCSDEQILGLYRAGILTGFDPSGTFHGQASLSRAEAAAMAARVLEPSLRLSFSPAPLPTEGYTLTHLMDGTPDCGITYPVCALSGWAEVSGLLTLDGRLLPWPEGGVPSYGLEEMGAYVKIAVYKDPTRLVDPYSTSPGMMDASGDWVVAPGIYDLIWPVEGGFYAWTTEDWTQWQGYRLDLTGQVAEELETTDGEPEPPGGWDNYTVPDLHSWDGLTVHSHDVAEGAYYVSSDGTAASQIFDWAGAIGPDGRGFVGLDGKIYRIEFAQ